MRPIFTAVLMFFCAASFALSNEEFAKYYNANPSKAAKRYESALKAAPYDKMLLYNAASACKETGDNEKAAAYYRRITEAHPSETRAVFELGKAYYFIGAYDYSYMEFVKLMRSGKVNWEVYYWAGCCALELNKYSEALSYLEKAESLDTRKAIIHIKKAVVFEKQGEYLKAVDSLKTALEKDRTFSELNINIALLYEKADMLSEAYAYYRRAGDIDTSNGEVMRKLLKYMELLPAVKKKIEEGKEQQERRRKAYIPADKKPVTGTDIPVIRVGIIEKANEVYFKCGSDFALKDEGEEELLRGERLKEYILTARDGKIQITDGEGNTGLSKKVYIIQDRVEATTSIYNVKFGEGFFWAESGDLSFRGDFLAVADGSRINFINLVNIEEYLYGVIPSEMPANWDKEALKAQAVCARTYTMRQLNRHKSAGFDLCATQHCAVYRGIRNEARVTNEAVDETSGELLYGADYKMLNTFYSHCCGGHTMDVAEIWGMRKNLSLRGVYDGRDREYYIPMEPFYLEEWVRTLPDVYCRATGNNEVSFRWIRYLNAEALNYYVNRRYKLGNIKRLEPVKRAEGGAMTRIYVEGDRDGREVGFDAMRNILGKIRGNVIKWEYRRDAAGYIRDIYIYGAGWGHHVGMCQRGARGMAEKGRSYTEILYHYYPGSYIKKKY